LLHKETGDKDSERRGQYLKKLFGKNVLGYENSILRNGGKDHLKGGMIFQNLLDNETTYNMDPNYITLNSMHPITSFK
jgi:hypothetical protein